MSEAKSAAAEPVIPEESKLLRSAYKKSGLTVADIAAAAGVSVPTLHIAFNGIRYRDGVGLAAAPSDQTLVKVGSVLRLDAQALRDVGRERAAGLLEEALNADDLPVARSSSDEIALAAVAGRRSLAKQILSIFSIDELRSEIERRTAQDELGASEPDDTAEDDDEAFHRELAEDLRTEQWPGQ